MLRLWAASKSSKEEPTKWSSKEPTAIYRNPKEDTLNSGGNTKVSKFLWELSLNSSVTLFLISVPVLATQWRTTKSPRQAIYKRELRKGLWRDRFLLFFSSPVFLQYLCHLYVDFEHWVNWEFSVVFMKPNNTRYFYPTSSAVWGLGYFHSVTK